MNSYNGEICEATLVIQGSKRGIHIVSHMDVAGLPPVIGVIWYTAYAVFDRDTGQQIGDMMTRAHSSAPWNTTDTADEDFVFWLDGAGGSRFQIEMYGFDGGQAPFVLCDIKTIGGGNGAPPPPPEEFPWKWVAIGGGVAVLAALLLRRQHG